MKSLFSLLCLITLAACSSPQTSVRVTNEKPVAVAPVATARNEPVFYNGKTYRLKFVPQTGGQYEMDVNGMSARQQKDAVAVATSSLRYFACPDGKTGKLTDQPRYDDNIWKMTARCG
jgi:hypothetical protein